MMKPQQLENTVNTRRYPRTMQEAFGPYTSHELHDPKSEDEGWLWWACIVGLSVAAAVVIAWTA